MFIILREETFVTMYNWLISLCLAALVNRVDAKFPKAMNNPHGSKMINPATNKRRQGRSEYSFSHDVGCQEGSPPGLDYTGIANMTEDGWACQVWAESNSDFSYLGEHNHCRNPNSDSWGVWCYTVELNNWGGNNWGLCPVPKCMESFLSIEAISDISDWNDPPHASTPLPDHFKETSSWTLCAAFSLGDWPEAEVSAIRAWDVSFSEERYPEWWQPFANLEIQVLKT